MAKGRAEGTARRHRLRAAILAVVALVLLVSAGVIAVALANPQAIATRVKERALPSLSERLGREVKVEQVKLSWFPPAVTLQGFSIAGETAEAPEPVAARSARVVLRLWPLLRSRGELVEVKAVELQEPRIRLVRRADGSFEHEELLARLRSQEDPSSRTVSVERLSIEDAHVTLVDHAAASGTGTVEVKRLSLEADNLVPGEKAKLSLKAALQGDRENLAVSLTVDPFPAPGAKLSGVAPEVTGNISVDRAPLARLRGFLPGGADARVTGGTVDLDLDVSTSRGTVSFGGTARVDDLALGGEPASGSVTLNGSMAPGNPESLAVTIRDGRLKGPGLDLSASGTLRGIGSARAELLVTGSLLNLDALLAALPEEPERTGAGGDVVPEAVRARLAGVDVSLQLKLQKVVRGKLEAGPIDAAARLSNGVLAISRGTAGVYAGTVNLAGTTVDLTGAVPLWSLEAALSSVDLGAATQALSGKSTVTGGASGKLDVRGRGADWAVVREQLTGTGSLALSDAGLSGQSLADPILGAVAEAFSRIGKRDVAAKLGKSAGATLPELTLRFRVEDGALELTRPITVPTPLGPASLGGAVGLDRTLDLDGTLSISRQKLAQLTGLKLPGSGDVKLPLQIGGTLEQPAVTGFDAGALVRTVAPLDIAKEEAGKAVRKQTEKPAKKLEKEMKDRLKGLFP